MTGYRKLTPEEKIYKVILYKNTGCFTPTRTGRENGVMIVRSLPKAMVYAAARNAGLDNIAARKCAMVVD